MRLRQKIGLVAVLAVLAAGATVAWLPARWALPWVAGSLPVQLQQVSGTLWNGRAGRVLAPDGELLGHAQWQLSRMALVGRTRLWLAVTGPRFELQGEMRREPGDRVAWRQVQARVDLALFSGPRLRRIPLRARGEISLQAPNLVLQGGWPLDGHATLAWRDAAIQTCVGAVAFGRLDAQLSARRGIMHGQWQDAGDGPLRTQGTLDASALGWRLQAELQARGNAPILQRWLATLGRPDATGTLHLERHGGLAAAPRMENPAP